MTYKNLFTFLLFSLSYQYSVAQKIAAVEYDIKPNTFKDVTEQVRELINSFEDHDTLHVVFKEGRYDFYPEKAEKLKYFITNTSSEVEYPSKIQQTGLYLKKRKNVIIDGQNSTFVFHGKMISWILDSCENVTIKNLKIDYDRPGMSEIKFLEIGNDRIIGEVHADSKFDIINKKLFWYGHNWVTEHFFALIVNKETGVNKYSSWDPFYKSDVRLIGNNIVEFTGDFKNFKASKGEYLTIRDHYRDYVGAFIHRSKNIKLENVHMKYMHGLGIVSQFSENLDFKKVYIKPDANSGRVIASSADGMQFSGCGGYINIDSCAYNGMHDDGINIHGTHLIVTAKDSIKNTIKLRFMHHQTYGFMPFSVNDELGVLKATTLKLHAYNKVKSTRRISDRELELELTQSLKGIQIGDAIENMTWTPTVSIKNSHISGTQTRGILVSTRKPVVIKNNTFYRTGMHAILIENDATGWYESGPVKDVLIENNLFQECGYNSFPNNYVIQISPHNTEVATNYWVHENIRILKNTFKVYDYPILSARSTKKIVFENNTILHTDFMNSGKERASFKFDGCTDVHVKGNDFSKGLTPSIQLINMNNKDIKSKF